MVIEEFKKQTKEFNLSDKMFHSVAYNTEILYAEHVKEFIKRLKEEIIKSYNEQDRHFIGELIDKLAGPKFI